MESTYICYVCIYIFGGLGQAIVFFFGPIFCVYKVFSVMAVIVCFGRLICDIMRNIIIFRDCNHVVNFRSSHSSQFKSQKISLYQKLYSHSISGMIPGIYFKDYLFFLVDHVYGSVGPGMSRMSSRFTGKIDLLNVKYINGTSVPTDVVVWISEPWTLSKHMKIRWFWPKTLQTWVNLSTLTDIDGCFESQGTHQLDRLEFWIFWQNLVLHLAS